MLSFFREKPRIVSAVANPILWLLAFGAGLGSSVTIQGVENYQQYIFPGILMQTFLFSSIFYGAYLVWDRRIDLLKAILVTPLSRSSIFLGKVLGGVTFSLLEAAIILAFGIVINIHYTVISVILTLLTIAVATAGLTAVGLTIGSFMTSPEGFQLITTFVIFPMFFLSGALYPLKNLNIYLATLNGINPLTYIVDTLRSILVGLQYFGTLENIAVTLGFTFIANIVGILAFRRMRS
jgi:ABC-2 type transport system permease protein